MTFSNIYTFCYFTHDEPFRLYSRSFTLLFNIEFCHKVSHRIQFSTENNEARDREMNIGILFFINSGKSVSFTQVLIHTHTHSALLMVELTLTFHRRKRTKIIYFRHFLSISLPGNVLAYSQFNYLDSPISLRIVSECLLPSDEKLEKDEGSMRGLDNWLWARSFFLDEAKLIPVSSQSDTSS